MFSAALTRALYRFTILTSQPCRTTWGAVCADYVRDLLGVTLNEAEWLLWDLYQDGELRFSSSVNGVPYYVRP